MSQIANRDKKVFALKMELPEVVQQKLPAPHPFIQKYSQIKGVA